MIRAATCFSGIGAPEAALPEADWLWHAELEKFPAAVMAARHPGSLNLGDVTADDFLQRASALGRLDLIVGGPPCFAAGHMVLLSKGYVPIESVRVGDLAVTHEGRLRKVVRIGNKLAPVGRLRMVGLPEGIVCTAEHRFLSRKWESRPVGKGSTYHRATTVSEPDWVAAESLPGQQWLSLTEIAVPAPKMIAGFTSADLMELAGWYLGDGWIRIHEGKRKKEFHLGLSPAKAAAFAERFPDLKFGSAEGQTCLKVSVYSTALAEWLLGNFGHSADGKTLPAWVFSHGNRADLLRGYLATDGHVMPSGAWKSITVSRSLAFGLAQLGNTLGYAVTVAPHETPATTAIQGRTVRQRDYYQVLAFPSSKSRKSRASGSHLLRTVQSWREEGTATVHDLEIEGDHSFILDGAIVHNCQDFSVAGKRAGIEGDRGNLSLRWVEIIHGTGAAVAVTENVPGWLNMGDNAFGHFLGALVGHDAALCSPLDGGGWPDAGMADGPAGRAAWRVADAQFFGLAQRRRRVFVVFSAGTNGIDPAAVLFERKGVRGDTAAGDG